MLPAIGHRRLRLAQLDQHEAKGHVDELREEPEGKERGNLRWEQLRGDWNTQRDVGVDDEYPEHARRRPAPRAAVEAQPCGGSYGEDDEVCEHERGKQPRVERRGEIGRREHLEE